MLSKHNGVQLEIDNKKITEISKHLESKQHTFILNPWVKEVVSKGIQKLAKRKWKKNILKLGA